MKNKNEKVILAIDIVVLDTKYKIKFLNNKLYMNNEYIDADCDFFTKTISVSRAKTFETNGEITLSMKTTIRHELIHAFIFECGLDSNGNSEHWASDEVCVEFFALQFEKLTKLFNNAFELISKNKDVFNFVEV